jgi:diguanylate cyclase (GGDEF)-like protein
MLGAAALGLLAHPGDRLHALVGMSVFYGVGVFALHRMVGASQVAAVDLQVRTEQLVAALAEEHVALGDANAQLSTSNAQLAHLALHDPLTGLYNRRGTLERIDGLLAASSGPNPVSLLFCDLDRFKAVNDLLGHRGGDQFIAVIADRIARSIDHRCIAGRIGGDEFVVALPGHDLATAAAVANRLVGVLAQPVHAEGREIPSSVSIGVAVSPSNGTTSSDLLRNANAALYHAKGSGRNRVELFDRDIELEHLAAVSAEHDLRRALELGEILPFFQPEIDASSGRIVGAELLARWLRSDGTVVNAAEFILLAKRAGLLERLTERVLGQARPYIRRLSSLGLPDGFRFRINLGPATTDRSWRDNPIDELVRGLEPGLLTVDVRESAVTTDLPAAAGTLAQFRARGGRVCLDDFARGVSSLSLLRRLPIDEVRIDRQAIDAIAVHPHDRAIVRSIIAVVREIGLAVTAEGVETGAQADALIALGCVRQQGHLYAPALPAIEFESFLLQRLAEGYVAGEQQHADWDEPLG